MPTGTDFVQLPAIVFDINRIFPWLSIRSKLIIAFAGLSIIPVALVGLHGVFSNVKMMKDRAYENLSFDVHTIRENTANFLNGVQADLRLVQSFPSFQELRRTLTASPHTAPRHSFGQLTDELLSFVKSRGFYYQIRMLNQFGEELLRVECLNPLDASRSYGAADRSELRESREHYYSLLVGNLDDRSIVFTPAELADQKNNRVSVISFATPIFSGGRRVAILVANVYAKDLFDAAERGCRLDMSGKVALVDHEGHYFYHSEKKKDWNKLLAEREEDNVMREYPPEVSKAILSGREGTMTEAAGEIVSYAPLVSLRKAQSIDETAAGLALPFFVFESVREDEVLGPVWSFAWTFGGFLLLFLATAIGLGLLATRQFTRPISALQRGAEIIAKGNYQHRLEVVTHDEIEKLAAQFNSMAASLEDHEREIQHHRAKLEEMVHRRTQELTGEKSKLQAILDNVPSAFVLLDKEFRIQTASVAFGSVTGLGLDDVRGRDCTEVFCGKGFCKECVSRKAMTTKQIESHVDYVAGPKSGGRYIEHVAVPMKENGEIPSILEIITDVTKRKRFEQRLVQTERLMAAGETSALIAHEFRNALTSVKMILQLQNESKHHSRSDKKSLGVALNSIYHMERVVTELLNFARPSPMAFRMEELANIVNESVNFIQLHISKRGIVLKKSLDPSIPPMKLDPPRFREALVNILLNAVQAIEGKPMSSSKEEVSIAAKKVILGATLRDYVVSDLVDNLQTENGSEHGSEIVIRKGTECVVVKVSDTGPGIPRSLVRRVFDPFFTTKSNGTGLGLPMVKQTVNAHGGIVGLETKKEHGTTFTITLPLNHTV